ncbi:amino acid adenylation domain-containing protein [Pseudomonas entomophila]|uniref:non-ribosomal peptide synthetase n=1 Tax=Pseudomonas entomophila TaxID=312306 RepID=UPI0023D7C460|nr:amino acid adenylation domain-containing protein [Pseudomonas entomophila]MDF0731696.1 amino acid adenylation domain-containing protein [Pseudomonas entomophila]
MSDINLEQLGAGLALLAEQQHWSEAVGPLAQQAHVVNVCIGGDLDLAALHAALDDLALRQQVLTSAIGAVAGYHGLRQFPAARPAQVAVTVEEPAQPESAAAAQRAQWLQRPVTQGPQFQALLQRLEGGQWHLTLALPRVLVDAGSLPLLLDQLVQAYTQGPAGADEELGQFEQYLEWRAEVVLDEDAGHAAQYWQAHLGNSAPALPGLPYRRKGGQAGEGGVAQVVASLPGELREALQALAAHHGVTADTVLQAAWWLLLARLSGRTAFIAGWRHDGRADYEFFDQTLGLFEKTLPLHLALDPALPFEQCLAPLAGVLEQHRTWQEYWSAEGRGTQPVHGFAVRRLAGAAQAKGAQWSPSVAAGLAPGFELALEVGLDGEGAVQQLSLAYLTQHYSAQAIAGLLAQYQVLLGGIVAAPSTAAFDLPLLGEAERARLLAFNPPAEAIDPRLTLAQRITEWASVTPDAPALVSAAQTLSYAELERRVQHLAAAMAARGVGAGQRVALALPRSAQWLVAALAAWRLGAAWLPLDPQWPAARLTLLLEQAGASLLVGEAALPVEAAQLDLGDVRFDGEAQALAERPAVSATDLAYVLFTSGSTGTPKAVAVEHGALFNYVAAASAALGLDACRRFAFGTSVVADLGHTTLFGALYHGAALHLADEATVQDGQAFAGFIEGQGIDCLKIVPSHLAALLETPTPVLPATLVLGGEAVAPALVERILRIRPDVRLFNHYGPSETTVGVLVHPISQADLDSNAVPLTQVLANNQVLVLDAQRKLVAAGELGELYIAGAQLARGYLNAPQQQAEAFVEHPLQPGARLYRTGDLARYRPEGGIVLQGRADQQVKLRGFRVELAEIEAELAALAGVSEAAVVLDAQHEPLAFVTAVGEPGEGWASVLKAQLAQRLPAVMVPRQVHGLARMPRLGNGKIDRQALATLDVGAAQQAYVAPRDALEQVLAERMAQLLGSERLSVEQDFFAAGGHSLLVIKLVAGIRKLLQCEVHPGVVFDNPSPAALARALRLQEGAPGQLEKLAQARLRLDAMSPEDKARLLEKARQLQGS